MKKKAILEESIRNAFLLYKQGVHPAVILFALKQDGLSSKQSKIIVRWAEVNSNKKKIITLTIPPEVS